MFTGIVEHVGRIASIELNETGGRVRVEAGPLAAGLAVSASIAVNGCCLTAVEITRDTFAADLSSETLRRTSFGQYKVGTLVNLERPLTAGKELGGHFVQGHVDGIGRVARIEAEGANWWLGVRVPAELERYVAMKGSIAIDGISLTVAGLRGDVFEVALIPFTYEHTNIRSMRAGNAVNLEADILAKYIERLSEARGAGDVGSSRLTTKRLIEEGF